MAQLQVHVDSSLQLQLASYALDWLKYYYWEPQKKAIPFHGNETAGIKTEIRSKFHELAFCIRFKNTPHLCSSKIKEKRGSKKDLTKILKSLVGLYSAFFSEVVSVLLEFLLKAINSSDSSELPVNTQNSPSLQISLNEWKLVIAKFSNKEPELLLALLNAVLDMIENQEAVIYETGWVRTSSDHRAETLQVEHPSSLFKWLVKIFEGLKPHVEKDSIAEIKVSSGEKTISKAILMELLRKCLVLSASANNQFMDSAVHLAQLTGQLPIGKTEQTVFIKKVSQLIGRKENWELNQCSGKREASSDLHLLDNQCIKKLRETEDGCVSDSEHVSSIEDVSGHLMIDRVWKRVGEEELLAIKSALRILI
ncbi:unnamed protein product [Prunus armeniaca]|uniref:Uncharacterized protein n=1 Tax=Prunus armeniaca TaxID=36596 RepID=A0A6J5WUG8_PRUAR|nr:unnamed protein product [Prunus armeniaca]